MTAKIGETQVATSTEVIAYISKAVKKTKVPPSQLARRIKLGNHMVLTKMMNGEAKRPHLDTVLAILEGLGVEVIFRDRKTNRRLEDAIRALRPKAERGEPEGPEDGEDEGALVDSP